MIEIIYGILEYVGLLLIVVLFFNSKKNKPDKRKNNEVKPCILIPARNEETVLSGLLDSINRQTYKIDSKDIYVIVQDSKDLGIDVANKYNVNVFKRVYPEKKRKGYALDECLKDILGKNKKYDLYFIFDADNILDKNYIENMIDSYIKGYDIVCGNRLNKNPNDNVISSSSGWIFTLLNIMNKLKSKHNENITLSGTGFFITGAIIKKLKGYPFNTMTEDYELSIYSLINNYYTSYNENAKYYDEQPTRLVDTITQRTRWIKGYFEVRKKYGKDLRKTYNKEKRYEIYKEIIGIQGIILFLIGFIINLIYKLSIMEFIKLFLIFYMVLMLITLLVLLNDDNEIKLSIKIKTIFFNPFFLLTYIWCLFKSFGKVSWKKIEHKKHI